MEMLIITLYFAISMAIAALLASLAWVAGMNSKNRNKLSPFECGFDPCKKARAPFSFRFFMVTILFLVFDVEIALILPLGILIKYSDPLMIMYTALILTLVITLGLLHEWNQGALNWQ
uniref:NADH-ubiquinone oxidoreductase chain 3 n=1 Tax=Gammarus roeselii TaxID=1080772 RepID=A0A343VUL6_9CRUS|nr:NADH dehydrogenase subunit 3 [Gammarus roeselii]AVP50038.1 NADH dehydrogenase subunit 3 [Gammarus roeselii]